MVKVLVAASYDLNQAGLSFDLPYNPTITSSYSSLYIDALYGEDIQAFGRGFVANYDGLPMSGTITTYEGVINNEVAWSIQGLSISAADFSRAARSASRSDDERLIEAAFSGDDTFYGGDGYDLFDGHAGIDYLFGNGDGDLLAGGDGNDVLNGGTGDDTIYGGLGVDTAVFEGNFTAYTFTEKSWGTWYVTGQGYTDEISSVETLKFDDGHYDFAVITNRAPVVATPIPDVSVLEDDFSVFFSIDYDAFTDPDIDILSYSATLANGKPLPSWLRSTTYRSFSGEPPENWTGSLDIRVTASDGVAAVNDVFRLTIKPVNDAPEIASGKGAEAATYVVKENVASVAALKARDVDGDKVSWSLSGKDAKLFSISKTGQLSFKSAPDFESPKDTGRNNVYDVTVKASDGKLSDSQALSIDVTNVKGKAVTGIDKANTLTGTLEADTITGKGAKDTITGGGGNDKFVFKALTDSTVSSKGRDTILDFTKGDRFDLSAIDANGKGKGNGAFTFVETDKFSGKAGELRYDKSKSDTYVYADVNGDKKADIAFHLDDAVKLAKADFLL